MTGSSNTDWSSLDTTRIYTLTGSLIKAPLVSNSVEFGANLYRNCNLVDLQGDTLLTISGNGQTTDESLIAYVDTPVLTLNKVSVMEGLVAVDASCPIFDSYYTL